MSDIVPDHWPILEDNSQQRLKPVSWLKLPWVLLTLLFVPKKHGPHIVESTWTKGIFVLCFSIAFASLIGLAGATLSQTQTDFFSNLNTPTPKISLAGKNLLDIPQLLVASGVNAVYKNDDYNSALAVTSLAIPGSYLALAPVAPLVFMPLIAGPLSPRRRYLHCLKIFLWTSIILVPAAIVTGITMYIGERVLYDLPSDAYANCCAAITGVLLLWLLIIVVKLGAFYRTDCITADEETRKPRCISCGYIISRIPLQSSCPECGTKISQSMPDKRQPVPWAIATFSQKPKAFCKTAWRILFGKQYFENRIIHKGRSSALTYLAASAAIAGIIVSLCLIPIMIDEKKDYSYYQTLSTAGINLHISVGVLGFGLIAGIAFFTGTIALTQWTSQFCRRDPRSILIVVAYYSGNLLKMFILIALVFVATNFAVDYGRIGGRSGFNLGDTYVRFESLFIILFALVALTITVRTMTRLQKELKITAFAYYDSTKDH